MYIYSSAGSDYTLLQPASPGSSESDEDLESVRPKQSQLKRWLLPGLVSLACIVTAIVVILTSTPQHGSTATTWLQNVVSESIDVWPAQEYAELQTACTSNDWRPGLYLNATLTMGLNNVRSEFATVLKWAFDAGAGIVLPRIEIRDNTTLSAWHDERHTIVNADHYYDVDHLKRILSVYCPQMHVREPFDTADVAAQVQHAGFQGFQRTTFRSHIDEFLKTHGITEWSPSAAIIVSQSDDIFAGWHHGVDPVGLDSAWWDMLRWAPRLMRLSNVVANADPLRRGYIGIHLRVERDVFRDWPTYEQQVDAYSFWLQQRPEQIIYLACGDTQFEKAFQARFPNHTVVTKWDIAASRPGLMTSLTTLAFDEAGAIDYQVLRRANFVMGIGLSSFAYFLGVDRRVYRTQSFDSTLHPDITPLPLRNHTAMLGDERTQLLPPIDWKFYGLLP